MVYTATNDISITCPVTKLYQRCKFEGYPSLGRTQMGHQVFSHLWKHQVGYQGWSLVDGFGHFSHGKGMKRALLSIGHLLGQDTNSRGELHDLLEAFVGLDT